MMENSVKAEWVADDGDNHIFVVFSTSIMPNNYIPLPYKARIEKELWKGLMAVGLNGSYELWPMLIAEMLSIVFHGREVDREIYQDRIRLILSHKHGEWLEYHFPKEEE